MLRHDQIANGDDAEMLREVHGPKFNTYKIALALLQSVTSDQKTP